MSGPVSTLDAPAVPDHGHAEHATVEISESHVATVGRFQVRRALPRRGRRTVGAWCFADHMGPASVTENAGLDVGPHPHIGLQAVTWLLDGQVLHRDSMGSEQVISPGQLNLMTAGGGVTHSEEATGHYRGELEGIQLWVALPDATRAGSPTFEHHTQLPVLDLDHGAATVLTGTLMGTTSPARHDSPLVGAELSLDRGTSAVGLRPGWEYAIVVLRGELSVAGNSLEPGHLGYLGEDRDELVIEASADTRAMLLGGEPFEEQILMSWNFVARNRDEMDAAYRSWQSDDGRFGRVDSPLARIPAPDPYWWETPPSDRGGQPG
jgi:redox-sensitive bicupin YhaK (pirin superfamily)